MVLIRNNLLDRLPTPFSRKSSCEIPFATRFIFQKSHIMHSHLTSRLPSAYEIHYDAISTQYIQHMLLYNNIIKAHKACYAHSPSITQKIISHGLIIKYEQFDLNYSTKHIISQKYFINTIHMNSETLGLLFTTTTQHRFHFVNPNYMAIPRLIHTKAQFMA